MPNRLPPSERESPRFYGVETYRDPLGRFSFRFPTGWQRFDLEGREGVMFGPFADDLQTGFTAWTEELEHPAVAEDLEQLRQGVDEGLAQLPDVTVEAASELALGNLIKFERVVSYASDGKLRKRKSWILYVDKWLIVLTWQGSSAEEYEYCLPMGNYAFATFEIPEALWFATDRDLFTQRQQHDADASTKATEEPASPDNP